MLSQTRIPNPESQNYNKLQNANHALSHNKALFLARFAANTLMGTLAMRSKTETSTTTSLETQFRTSTATRLSTP
ncbi:hypothetical protein MCOR01_007444 [Pyricularia oryzae]|nr:hypothetical protein MCOR01_007444 [Pyricularia oryzae]